MIHFDDRLVVAKFCKSRVYDKVPYGIARTFVDIIYTVSQKKQDTKLLAIISPTIIRFSKFYHQLTR